MQVAVGGFDPSTLGTRARDSTVALLPHKIHNRYQPINSQPISTNKFLNKRVSHQFIFLRKKAQFGRMKPIISGK